MADKEVGQGVACVEGAAEAAARSAEEADGVASKKQASWWCAAPRRTGTMWTKAQVLHTLPFISVRKHCHGILPTAAGQAHACNVCCSLAGRLGP